MTAEQIKEYLIRLKTRLLPVNTDPIGGDFVEGPDVALQPGPEDPKDSNSRFESLFLL